MKKLLSILSLVAIVELFTIVWPQRLQAQDGKLVALVGDAVSSGIKLGYAAASLGASRKEIEVLCQFAEKGDHAGVDKWFAAQHAKAGR